MPTLHPAPSVSPSIPAPPILPPIPWQAWLILRYLRTLHGSAWAEPIEFQITATARVLQVSKGNVIRGIEWLTTAGVVTEHDRTAFGARRITVSPIACLCGGSH